MWRGGREFDEGKGRWGGVEGRTGLLWDPSDTDIQPFVVSLTVCFQFAVLLVCTLHALWVHVQDSMCRENNSHHIFKSNEKRDEKVEIIL